MGKTNTRYYQTRENYRHPHNTEVCHTLDLERVQYVGMSTVDGHYEVTMGRSESIKLNEDVYPRKELVKKWKMYHGQC